MPVAEFSNKSRTGIDAKMTLLRSLATLVFAVAAHNTSAGLIVNADEVASDVVMSFAGSFDLSATLGFDDDRAAFGGRYDATSFFRLVYGNSPTDDYDLNFTSAPAVADVGNGSALTAIQSGDAFLFEWTGPLGAFNQIWVPDGYVSNNPLSGSMTFQNQTLAGLGLNAGGYTWEWENQGNSDFLTFNVNASDVPVPSTLALFGLGLLGLRLRRKG